jgi:hypothetical protein
VTPTQEITPVDFFQHLVSLPVEISQARIVKRQALLITARGNGTAQHYQQTGDASVDNNYFIFIINMFT